MSNYSLLIFWFLLLPLVVQSKNEENEIKEIPKVILDSGGERNFTTNPISETKNQTPTYEWMHDAIIDIAYYLRSHKFNEYDRRYERFSTNASRTYFQKFPNPPLRALHWEVRKNCEQDLPQCLLYVWRKIKKTILQRNSDTSILMDNYNWTTEKNQKEITSVEVECQKGRELDFKVAEPFEGPLERFQWRTTVSYYFCWFTLLQLPQFKHFGSRCDNFAACLDPNYGPYNRDPRANDSKPFQCALYSFCPDPCCPIKHITSFETCWNHKLNPCKRESPPKERQCHFSFETNQEFSNLILNHWNVSCKCPQSGYEWSSTYGICIDIDECARNMDENCDHKREACVNLPGKYFCACKNEFEWNDQSGSCEKSVLWDQLRKEELQMQEFHEKQTRKNTKATSIFSLIKKWFT